MRISSFKSSSPLPIIRMIRLGLLIKPSSSARIAKWKYSICAVAGISRKASLSMMVFANILRSAIGIPPLFVLKIVAGIGIVAVFFIK